MQSMIQALSRAPTVNIITDKCQLDYVITPAIGYKDDNVEVIVDLEVKPFSDR